jgi:hypothetical protein
VIPPKLKFIHSMRERDYLDSALKDGLLLTNHPLTFTPTENRTEMQSLMYEFIPFLKNKLIELGKPLESLEKSRRKLIFQGIGSFDATAKMLCFTEVPEGRDISFQNLSFGGYGLVIKRTWLEKNNADRIIYIGQNSVVSRHLFRNLSALRIASLHVNDSEQVLFDSFLFSLFFDLLPYIETRENLEEFEWRIVKNPKSDGENSQSEDRIQISLDEIEYVLVKREGDISDFSALIAKLAVQQNTLEIPRVLCQPSFIPV